MSAVLYRLWQIPRPVSYAGDRLIAANFNKEVGFHGRESSRSSRVHQVNDHILELSPCSHVVTRQEVNESRRRKAADVGLRLIVEFDQARCSCTELHE